jgi:hypothetical protein
MRRHRLGQGGVLGHGHFFGPALHIKVTWK